MFWAKNDPNAGRAMCAHRNMLAGPVLFAALLLVAQLLGKGNDMIVCGAQVLFWARVADAGIYTPGCRGCAPASWRYR